MELVEYLVVEMLQKEFANKRVLHFKSAKDWFAIMKNLAQDH